MRELDVLTKQVKLLLDPNTALVTVLYEIIRGIEDEKLTKMQILKLASEALKND